MVVDGITATAEGLAGKPAPDTFLPGAELLGVAPDRSIVVEDAVSGVAAGKAGGFAFVIGIDRGGNAGGARRPRRRSIVDRPRRHDRDGAATAVRPVTETEQS